MRVSYWVSILFLLGACGGGGGGGGGNSGGGPTAPVPGNGSGGVSSDFDQGLFRNSSVYKDQCAVPRSGNFPDRLGSRTDENNWLRAWSHDLYLWYDEIVDVDPAAFSTPAYFDLMKTNALTPSGSPKDQFHFTLDTQEYLQRAQSGVAAGYGTRFVLAQSVPPREIRVAYVEDRSPAARAGSIRRGDRILEIDGVDAVFGTGPQSVTTLNDGLFPSNSGEQHTFLVEDFAGNNERLVTLTSATITSDPVPTTAVFARPSGNVGYLLFNEHVATAERALVDAVEAFARQSLTDLIVDLRYNGGGFLEIANVFAYMLVGQPAAGQVFESIEFNDKHPSVNPVTGQALTPQRFRTTAQGFSVATGTPLPTLGLNRVFVLTSEGTCSASEAVINGLRGVDLEVVQIGGATCGKPYGFYATDNCGTSYFTIQFRAANAKGFGDYADGFIPVTGIPTNPAELPGCPVSDDFSEALGSADENLLETALAYLEGGLCPSPSVRSAKATPNPLAKQMALRSLQAAALPDRLPGPKRMPGRVLR